jgi:hypothetical protein
MWCQSILGRKRVPFHPTALRFFTHPRSKSASLAEIAYLEGTKEFGEGSAFVRLFKVADWLLPNQTKRDKPTKSVRAESTFLCTGLILLSILYEILNQEPREKVNTKIC